MTDHGMPHFNVFDGDTERSTYHDAPSEHHVIHRSPDGRHLTFYGRLPEGVRFSESPRDVEETFYIIEGSIRCTPKGGETIVWRAGDLVYWPYQEELDLEYSPGLRCICFFWSDVPLPDFTEGEP
ncbi:MAG TPA: cupin domain-containing protein [Solirubrobacteraceae bacterium]|nr:cupin domain-containing protein [Solirubrobacteraceae bacterium]